MYLNYKELDVLLYCFEAFLGVVFLSLSLWMFKLASIDIDPIRYVIPGFILVIIGLACVLREHSIC